MSGSAEGSKSHMFGIIGMLKSLLVFVLVLVFVFLLAFAFLFRVDVRLYRSKLGCLEPRDDMRTILVTGRGKCIVFLSDSRDS